MYRKRYFMDGHETVPPLSKDVRWSWLPHTSPDLAETVWDTDLHVYDVAINEALRHWPDMMKITLLHELTHCRLGPGVKCQSACKRRKDGSGRANPIWSREAARLAALGAPLL
jgi:hypothetical protein